MRALGLGDLVFMVRELEVLSAAVDIEVFAEQFGTHRRALDVPSRTATPPGRIPLDVLGFAFLGSFPEHEIERVVFVLDDADPFARAQLVQRFAGQVSVVRETAHRVAHVAIGGMIGKTLFFQLRDDRLHVGDVVGRPRLEIRAQHSERVGVFVHRRNETIRQCLDRLAVFLGAADDFVIHIGDVAHVAHLESALPQPAHHHVEDHHHSCVPEMAVVVNRHSANVDAGVTGLEGTKNFFSATERVIDCEHADDRV